MIGKRTRRRPPAIILGPLPTDRINKCMGTELEPGLLIVPVGMDVHISRKRPDEYARAPRSGTAWRNRARLCAYGMRLPTITKVRAFSDVVDFDGAAKERRKGGQRSGEMIFADFAKDFAAPVATIAAASAAAFVTLSIQRQNQRLAEARLKLDLYNKRYEVYAATRDLLLLLTRNTDVEDPETKAELSRIYFKMTEAPFCCGERAQAFCRKVRATDQRWRNAKAIAAVDLPYMVPGPEKAAVVLAPVEASAAFLQLIEEIVPAFSPDLNVEMSKTNKRRWWSW